MRRRPERVEAAAVARAGAVQPVNLAPYRGAYDHVVEGAQRRQPFIQSVPAAEIDEPLQYNYYITI